MSQMTYGHLKERVLGCLFEHEPANGETVVLDNARSAAISRMPDIVYQCLVRMFETLAVGRKRVHLELAASEKTGYVKAELPYDFGRIDGVKNGCFNPRDYYIENGYIYFDNSLFVTGKTVDFYYRALPPKITSETDDGFVIELSPLAFEALVCLCALELCRPEDASLYTKLYYKYSDLCQGLNEPLTSARCNSFFSADSKKRWTR